MEGLDAISETAEAAAVELAVSTLRSRGESFHHCANCAAPVLGAYCGTCGQPNDTHRRSVGHLIHDFISDLVSFDSRILRTTRALLFEPGELPLAFREGRTQRYVPAVRLYLFVTLIFFLVLSTSGIAILQLALAGSSHSFVSDAQGHVIAIKDGKRSIVDGLRADAHGNVYVADSDVPQIAVPGMKADGSVVPDLEPVARLFAPIGSVHSALPAGAAAYLKKAGDIGTSKSPFGPWIDAHVHRTFSMLATNPAAINGPLTEWIPRVLFVLLPIFALLLAMFYWRRKEKFYFVDHLVFSLNIHTFFFAALLIAVGLAQIASRGTIAWLLLLSAALYLLLAMKRFYKQGWFWTGTKFVAVSSLYVVFFLLPALGGIILVSLLGL